MLEWTQDEDGTWTRRGQGSDYAIIVLTDAGWLWQVFTRQFAKEGMEVSLEHAKRRAELELLNPRP